MNLSNRGSRRGYGYSSTCLRLTVLGVLAGAIALVSVNSGAARTIEVKPGANLGRVTTNAKDGDVIKLASGEYGGQVVVVSKTLVVKGATGGGTVFSSPESQTLVYVSEGGNLTLENVAFNVAGQTELAVYVKDGSAFISRCEIANTPQGAIFVDHGNLTVSECRFTDIADDAIAGVNQAKLVVRGTVFSGVQGGAIVGQGSTALDVSGSRFENIEKFGILGADRTSIVLHDSEFVGINGRGVQVQEGSRVEVYSSSFAEIGEVGILGLDGSSVRIEESSFTQIRGTAVHVEKDSRLEVARGSFKDVEWQAVAGFDGASIQVRDSTFERIRKIAIELTNGKTLDVQGSGFLEVIGAVVAGEGIATVVIKKNVISGVPTEETPIWVRTSGKVVIAGNIILSTGSGLSVRGAWEVPAEITGNTIVAANQALYVEAQGSEIDDTIRIIDNRIVSFGQYAVLLTKTPRALLTGNVILTKGEDGVAIQDGSFARLNGNVIAGSRSAVFVHETAGKGGKIGNDLVIEGIYPESGLRLGAEAGKIAVILGRSDVEGRLRTLVEVALSAAETATRDNLSELTTSLDALTGEAEAIRNQAKTLASITLEATDAIGQLFTPEFTVLDIDSNPISEHGAANPAAIVAPGTYLVEPVFDPILAQEITVGTGEEAVVEVKAEDYLVLKFGRRWVEDDVPIMLPIVLKERQRAQQALKGLRPNFPKEEIFAIRRPDVTQGKINEALILARDALPTIHMKIHELSQTIATLKKVVENRDDDAILRSVVAMNKARSVFRAAARIISIAGEQQDVKQLVEDAYADMSPADVRGKVKSLVNERILDLADTDFLLPDKELALAAYVENRLGTLDGGAVAVVLQGTDAELAVRAGVYLHYYGLDMGDAALIDYLRDPDDKDLVLRAVSVLLDSAGPAVLGAMRSIVQKYSEGLARKDDALTTMLQPALSPSALYLLGYGNMDDWRLVASLEMDEDFALDLALLVEDARPLVDYFFGLIDAAEISPIIVADAYDGWTSALASLCPALRDLEPGHQAAVEEHIASALAELGAAVNFSGRGPGSDRKSARAFYHLRKSFCRATGAAAELVFEQNTNFFWSDMTWIPQPWLVEGIVKSPYWYQWQTPLEYVPHADLAKALKEHNPEDTEILDIYLAYHEVASYAQMLMKDEFPGGVERRAFVLTNSDPAGALSGVLNLRPELLDGKLRLGLWFDLADYSVGTMISAAPQFFRQMVTSRGEGLIGKIQLRRGDEIIPVVKVESAGEGGFVYEAGMGEPDLSNLYLHVTLKLFDQTWPLDFDLFASDYARNLQRAAGGN